MPILTARSPHEESLPRLAVRRDRSTQHGSLGASVGRLQVGDPLRLRRDGGVSRLGPSPTGSNVAARSRLSMVPESGRGEPIPLATAIDTPIGTHRRVHQRSALPNRD